MDITIIHNLELKCKKAFKTDKAYTTSLKEEIGGDYEKSYS